MAKAVKCATLVVSALVISALTGTVQASGDEHKGHFGEREAAVATIFSCVPEEKTPERLGRARLMEELTDQGVKTVRVTMRLKGLTRGEHAVHIHENAECEPCSAAGGHFDPGLASDTSPDGNHPFHMGDLVNIKVGKNGRGTLNTVTTRIALSPGPLSIFDEDGSASSAFIIHVNPDTFCPKGEEAGCAGGGRAACGIIELL